MPPNFTARLRWGWLAILLSLLMVACGPGEDARVSDATPTPIPTPVRPVQPTYTVQRGDVVAELTFNARVAGEDETRFYFRRDGFVARVLVQKGDDVHEGDILAELDASQLQRSLARAQHDLQAAEQTLAAAKTAHQDELTQAQWQRALAQAQLEDAREQARSQLTIARQQLAKLQAQDPAPQKAKAEAALEQARIHLQQAQAAYDAIAWRPDVGATPEAAQLQQATLAFQQAQAAYDLAMQAIATHANDLKIQQEQVALAQRRWQRLQDEAIDTPEEQALAQTQLQLDILDRGLDPTLNRQVEDARFQVQDLQAQLDETRITAPRAARVIALSLTPGQAVKAYAPVIILADPAQLEVTAQLTADEMETLHEGQPVTITLAGRPGPELPGHIRQLPYPYGAGGSGQSLENADPFTHIQFDADPTVAGLAMGDLVEVHTILARKENVLWLPPAAIRTFGGRQFVVIQDGPLRRRVDVTTGLESDNRVEILSGVEEGQIVVAP